MVLEFPIEYANSGQSFIKALRDKLSNYYMSMRHLGCSEEKLKNIKSFSRCIINTIKLYYSGKVHSAYTEFTETFSDFIGSSKENFIYRLEKGHRLFRARVCGIDQEFAFSNDDMFHIPFESRTKVKNHRYSISGLPCLYIADSVYTCWIEMNRPQLERFAVAQLTTNREITLFDMCKIYSIFMSDNHEEKIRYADFLHIIIACSFLVKNRHDEFKPEYIIPQFIMQWLLDNKYGIVGIKYFTNLKNIDYKCSRLYINYVLHARKNSESGFCEELKKFFTVNRTICGVDLQYSRKSNTQYGTKLPDNNSEYYYMVDNIKRDYRSSMFGLFEEVLACKENNFDSGDLFILHH